jgi:heme exporter protein B
MILAIISRDSKLAFNNIGQFFNPIIFFFIAISIFAISFSNIEADNLLSYQLSVIWFCLIFSIIVSINNFLRDDFLDGTLEQIIVNNSSFEIVILAKIISNWLIYCLPLIIFIPLAAIILGIKQIAWLDLILLAVIVTLLINLIGCFCASLTMACNKNESLLTILILPLIIPILIFANSAFIDYGSVNFTNSLIFLGLIFAFLSPILVFATAFCIKISIQD